MFFFSSLEPLFNCCCFAFTLVIFGILYWLISRKGPPPENEVKLDDGLREMIAKGMLVMQKKKVAVLGASADRSKFSNKAVRAYVQEGWEVYPVNPKGGTIEGLKAYTSLSEIPGNVDRVTVYLPAPVAVKALAEIAQIRPDELYINPGAESDELVAEAARLGLDPILACSIIDIGVSPSAFPG